MFAIAITCVQHLSDIKGGQKKIDDLDSEIQNYKREVDKWVYEKPMP